MSSTVIPRRAGGELRFQLVAPPEEAARNADVILALGCRFSDIHCGMRGITLDAFKRMELHSESWEYASEMVLKAARKGLRIAEVPVKFYKDREELRS